MEDESTMYKIVIIGSSGTGKTNICSRYIEDKYYDSLTATVGVEFLNKIVKIQNTEVKVSLWDTAGQERYKAMNKLYYKGANGVLVVYDVTNPQSYIDVQSWIRYTNQNLNLEQVEMIIVGNKMDLEHERKVQKKRAIKQYKERFDVDCWQVSAKTGQNVNELFSTILQRIHDKCVKQSVYIEESAVYESVSERASVAQQIAKEALGKPSMIKEVKEEEQDVRRPDWQLAEIHSPSFKKSKEMKKSMQLSPPSREYKINQPNSPGNKRKCC